MVIMKGYKQTEVGVIPMDWEDLSIGECFSFKNGLNKEKHFFGQGTPIVNYMDVYKHSGVTSNDINGKVTVSTQELRNYEVRKGDVFFTRTSETVEEIGITSVILVDLFETVFSGFLLRARPTNLKLELEYKKYCFSSSTIRKQISSSSSYTTRALTNGKLLSKIIIPIPPKLEQTAIATALSDADALITSLEKLIEKKRAIKQGAMQQLLEPKQGWMIKALGEVADILTGFPFPSNGYSKYGVRLLRGSNIKRGKTDWNEDICEYWPKITSELQKYQLRSGDVVVAMDGSLVGKSFAQLSNIDIPSILLQRVARIRSTIVDINYLKELICSTLFTAYCDSVKTASAIPHISPADIYNFKINYPSEESEQTRIASILSDMDKEIESLEQKLSKYKRLKQGMMQELLTGKIRLV